MGPPEPAQRRLAIRPQAAQSLPARIPHPARRRPGCVGPREPGHARDGRPQPGRLVRRLQAVPRREISAAAARARSPARGAVRQRGRGVRATRQPRRLQRRLAAAGPAGGRGRLPGKGGRSLAGGARAGVHLLGTGRGGPGDVPAGFRHEPRADRRHLARVGQGFHERGLRVGLCARAAENVDRTDPAHPAVTPIDPDDARQVAALLGTLPATRRRWAWTRITWTRSGTTWRPRGCCPRSGKRSARTCRSTPSIAPTRRCPTPTVIANTRAATR